MKLTIDGNPASAWWRLWQRMLLVEPNYGGMLAIVASGDGSGGVTYDLEIQSDDGQTAVLLTPEIAREIAAKLTAWAEHPDDPNFDEE